MSTEYVYVDGRVIPECELRISPDSPAFVYGTSLTERLRTFGGKLFRAEAHRRRLADSLEAVGVGPAVASAELFAAGQSLVERNRSISGREEVGLAVVVMPGPPDAPNSPASEDAPRVVMHTYQLGMRRWARAYREGVRLATSSVRHVPNACWPRAVKCRSRMHYYLALQKMTTTNPGTVPLMLDAVGHVTETPTANIVAYNEASGFHAPPQDDVLPGISIDVLAELAAAAGIDWRHGVLTPDELAAADEVYLTSTSCCMLPVTELDGKPIGPAVPGPVYRRLLADWSKLVGVDIAEQASRLAAEET